MSTVLTYPGEEKKELSQKVTNLLFLDAFSDKASDIHLEPLKNGGTEVRYRINGNIIGIKELTPEVSKEVILCLKRLAGLNPEIKDTIQKGHIMVKAEQLEPHKDFDLMMGILPTIYGERINLAVRSMEKAQSIMEKGFELLGFEGADLETVKSIFNKSFGLIFITGTPGSGKTTTCHGALNYIKKKTSGRSNIISLEDWIAYPLEGIVQVKVEPKEEGKGFYENLKALMWQDPDFVFVSSLPDKNTARMICEVALTGHLVLVQMGSPDIIQAIKKLIELDIDPCLLASILEGGLGQRLVRRICSACKEEYTPSKEIVERYFQGMTEKEGKLILYKGKGCEKCRNSGYTGRTGIYELINPDIKIKI